MDNKVKVIVIGCGNMGSSHARAYHKLAGFDLVGLVDINPEIRNKLSEELRGIDQFEDFETAMMATKTRCCCSLYLPRNTCRIDIEST